MSNKNNKDKKHLKALTKKEIEEILTDLKQNREKLLFFDWENDTDINPDFALWEQELLENN